MAVPNSAATDIATYLDAQAIGTLAATSGWAIYTSKLPTSPHTIVATFDTGGFAPDPKWLLDYPTVQVRIRGGINDYDDAFAKAQEVKDTVLGIQKTTIGGSVYVGITMAADVLFVNYDDNKRPLFTVNFEIWREPSDATNRQALA